MLVSMDSGVPVRDAADFRNDIKRTACITGHRMRGVLPWRGDSGRLGITLFTVKKMLARCIDVLAERGYDCFIDGLAAGTDLWAAEHILWLKEQGSDIELVGAMPYLRHAQRHSREDAEILVRAERGADMLVTTCTDPLMDYGKREGAHVSPELYKVRNYFMVDNSTAVAAFLNDTAPSGTLQTVSYARRRGRSVLRFSIEDVWRALDECGPDRERICRYIADIGWELLSL